MSAGVTRKNFSTAKTLATTLNKLLVDWHHVVRFNTEPSPQRHSHSNHTLSKCRSQSTHIPTSHIHQCTWKGPRRWSRFEREEGPLYIPVVVTLLNTVSRSSKAEAGLSPQKLGGQLRSQISTSLSPQMPSRNNNSQAEPSWQITSEDVSWSCQEWWDVG